MLEAKIKEGWVKGLLGEHRVGLKAPRIVELIAEILDLMISGFAIYVHNNYF